MTTPPRKIDIKLKPGDIVKTYSFIGTRTGREYMCDVRLEDIAYGQMVLQQNSYERTVGYECWNAITVPPAHSVAIQLWVHPNDLISRAVPVPRRAGELYTPSWGKA